MSDLCVHSSDLKLMLFDHLSYNLPCNHHLSIIPRPSFMRKYSRLSGVTALQSASSEEGSPWWKESSVIQFQWLSNSSKLFIIITMTIFPQLSPPWQSLPRLMWTALTSCCPVLLSCRLNDYDEDHDEDVFGWEGCSASESVACISMIAPLGVSSCLARVQRRK